MEKLGSEQRLVTGACAKPDPGPGWFPGFAKLGLGLVVSLCRFVALSP